MSFVYSSAQAISYAVIPKQYWEPVKKAIDKLDADACPVPKGKDYWVYKVCVKKILYVLKDESSCQIYFKNQQAYAGCLGAVAKAKKDKRLCDRLPPKRPKEVCIMSFMSYTTVQTDYLDFYIKRAKESELERAALDKKKKVPAPDKRKEN